MNGKQYVIWSTGNISIMSLSQSGGLSCMQFGSSPELECLWNGVWFVRLRRSEHISVNDIHCASQPDGLILVYLLSGLNCPISSVSYMSSHLLWQLSTHLSPLYWYVLQHIMQLCMKGYTEGLVCRVTGHQFYFTLFPLPLHFSPTPHSGQCPDCCAGSGLEDTGGEASPSRVHWLGVVLSHAGQNRRTTSVQ